MARGPRSENPPCPPLTPSSCLTGQAMPSLAAIKSLPATVSSTLCTFLLLQADHWLRGIALASRAHRSNVRTGRHRQGAGSCEAGVGPNVAALPRSVARARPDFPGVAAAAERLEEAAGWRSCC